MLSENLYLKCFSFFLVAEVSGPIDLKVQRDKYDKYHHRITNVLKPQFTMLGLQNGALAYTSAINSNPFLSPFAIRYALKMFTLLLNSPFCCATLLVCITL